MISTYTKSDLDSSSLILNRVEFNLPSQGFIKVTNVDFYNGKMVDAIFKNEHNASAIVNISSTGGIRLIYKRAETKL